MWYRIRTKDRRFVVRIEETYSVDGSLFCTEARFEKVARVARDWNIRTIRRFGPGDERLYRKLRKKTRGSL